MEPIWNWGNQFIVTIQTIHSPGLDAFFNAVTFLGEEEFFLLIFPLVIWVVNKTVGYRLAYLVLISITLNTWAKLIFNHPRPFDWPSETTSPVLKLNERAWGPGIPSGHAQTSLVLWFYLAHKLKQGWFWLLAVLLFVLVSFSRIYLGVHFPTDVLGGAVLGLVILLLFLKLEPQFVSGLSQAPSLLIGLALVVPLILIWIQPHQDAVATMSTLSGFSLGIIFEQHKVDFQVAGPIIRRLIRFVVGLILLVVIFETLALLVPPPDNIFHFPATFTRYAIAGFWVSGGGPWLFTQINLAQTCSPQVTPDQSR